MAVFTLVVITVSSTYSPVLDCVFVDAQPSVNSSAKIVTNDDKYLSFFMSNFLDQYYNIAIHLI